MRTAPSILRIVGRSEIFLGSNSTEGLAAGSPSGLRGSSALTGRAGEGGFPDPRRLAVGSAQKPSRKGASPTRRPRPGPPNPPKPAAPEKGEAEAPLPGQRPPVPPRIPAPQPRHPGAAAAPARTWAHLGAGARAGTRRRAHLEDVVEDGVAELEQRLLVELAAVDDAHLLEEGGLAALARAQQQDLHEPLHVGLLPGQAFVDLLGLALLLGLAARQHAAREAHGQHGPRRQEVRHLAAAASAGPSGSLHLLLGRRAAPATRLEGGERCGGPSAPAEGGNQRGDSQGGPGRAGRASRGGREGGRAQEGRWPPGVRAPAASRERARTHARHSRFPASPASTGLARARRGRG